MTVIQPAKRFDLNDDRAIHHKIGNIVPNQAFLFIMDFVVFLLFKSQSCIGQFVCQGSLIAIFTKPRPKLSVNSHCAANDLIRHPI